MPERSMLLPSASDLVRAFVRDLGNVFDAGSEVAPKTRALCFESGGAAATLAFKADKDYRIIGWQHANGYNVAISTSGRASVPLTVGAGRVSDGIFFLTTTATQTLFGGGVSIPLAKDQTMTVWIGAASGAVVVYLTEA
jgi:hypothetical protein